MKRTDYRRLARMTRGWMRGTHSLPIHIDEIKRAKAGVGIYLACRVDGELLYVGSAVRPDDPYGVGRRVLEHPLKRRSSWRWVWVLPLRDETPRDVVLAIEGHLIDHLRPPMNRRRHVPVIVPVFGRKP